MILGWSFYAIGREEGEFEASDCVLSKLSLQPKFSAFLMDGLASFHDSASRGCPDYCYRKLLRSIRRVYLGVYKKGVFLDQYDSVQNGIKTNYVTFQKSCLKFSP